MPASSARLAASEITVLSCSVMSREMIGRLDVVLEAWNPLALQIDHQQRHARQLEVLRESGVIDVVVRGQPISELREWHTCALKIRAHRLHRTWPAEVHQQA